MTTVSSGGATSVRADSADPDEVRVARVERCQPRRDLAGERVVTGSPHACDCESMRDEEVAQRAQCHDMRVLPRVVEIADADVEAALSRARCVLRDDLHARDVSRRNTDTLAHLFGPRAVVA